MEGTKNYEWKGGCALGLAIVLLSVCAYYGGEHVTFLHQQGESVVVASSRPLTINKSNPRQIKADYFSMSVTEDDIEDLSVVSIID